VKYSSVKRNTIQMTPMPATRWFLLSFKKLQNLNLSILMGLIGLMIKPIS